jgi:hypothetical protein
MTKIEVTEELRQAVIEAVAGALGGCAYDCTKLNPGLERVELRHE